MAETVETAPASEERQRAAIGPRADYYLRRWREMDARGRKASWNWPAGLLNVVWCAYRKLWGPMAAMGLVVVLASPFLDPTHKTIFKIAAVVLIGSSFVTGYFGNHLYRAKIERIVAETTDQDAEGADARAAARGGVSMGAALAALVVVTLLGAVAGMVPALLARAG